MTNSFFEELAEFMNSDVESITFLFIFAVILFIVTLTVAFVLNRKLSKEHTEYTSDIKVGDSCRIMTHNTPLEIDDVTVTKITERDGKKYYGFTIDIEIPENDIIPL